MFLIDSTAALKGVDGFASTSALATHNIGESSYMNRVVAGKGQYGAVFACGQFFLKFGFSIKISNRDVLEAMSFSDRTAMFTFFHFLYPH